MPINYRNVDPHKVASDVMKDRAKEWEERAFADEGEVKRLEILQRHDSSNAEVAEALMKKRGDAKASRGKAKRAAGAAPLDVEEVIEIRVTFLNRWLTDIETNHAAQTALIEDAKRLVGLKGKDALTSTEKKEVRDELVEAEKSLAIFEDTHGLVTGLIDAHSEHPDANGNGKASAEALAALEV